MKIPSKLTASYLIVSVFLMVSGYSLGVSRTPLSHADKIDSNSHEKNTNKIENEIENLNKELDKLKKEYSSSSASKSETKSDTKKGKNGATNSSNKGRISESNRASNRISGVLGASDIKKISNSKFKDGKYRGSSYGYSSNIEVEVEVKDGKISNIDIVSQNETPEYFEKALSIKNDIISKQSVDIDSVSGATLSSNAIKLAVFQALKKAEDTSQMKETSTKVNDDILKKIESEMQNISKKLAEKKHLESVALNTSNEKLKDGKYKGSAYGYNSEVEVEVEVKDGKISNIDIVSQNETPEYFRKAISIKNEIVKKQSLDVDSVSGATLSSNAIKIASMQAIKKAGSAITSEIDTTINTSINSMMKSLKELKEENSELSSELSSLREKLEKALITIGSVQTKKNLEYSDGKYRGRGTGGYAGDVEVEVTIRDHRIDSIEVLSHNETPTYFKKARRILESIIGKQSTEVDSISKATLSSNAIKAACKDALNKASEKFKEEELKKKKENNIEEDKDKGKENIKNTYVDNSEDKKNENNKNNLANDRYINADND
ncbi:FMN-binding protein [Peptostreptococcus russellii]|uniref:FMN-binding protein n=1 Tax=Peptostreptococcus russellii TaxID=215200 RepID=UPI0029431606|nr:FMN-binding protein [Peptostreptococcus russellii]